MSANKNSTNTSWTDPDDAPELTDDFFTRADEFVAYRIARHGLCLQTASHAPQHALCLQFELAGRVTGALLGGDMMLCQKNRPQGCKKIEKSREFTEQRLLYLNTVE